MKKNLVFASKKHQTLPFTIGGVTFWSKRLTGEEELLMAEGSDAVLSPAEQLYQQAVRLAEMLTHRLQDQSVQIDQEWALKHLGTANTLELVKFWRTGERPVDFQNETFDLPEWGESLVLGEGDDEHEFEARATSFKEQIALAQSTPAGLDFDNLSDAESVETIRTLSVFVTDLVNARLKRGEPVDASWLLKQLQIAEITQLMTYLTSGEVPVEEEADPNAEGAAALSA